MVWTSLDAIVRDFIMRRRYTMHDWIAFMVYSKNCLRELSFDDLKCVNTKKLPVNQDDNTVEIPNDYQDYVNVNVQAGQHLKPLVESDKINPLVNRDSDFNPIRYDDISQQESGQVLFGYLYPSSWHTVTWNSYGEFTGRMFGSGAGFPDDTFSVFKERNQIQLCETISTDYIVLRYISNGLSADAATQVDQYASETISAYIMWQMKEHNRTYSEGEKERAKQEYINQRMILRARMSDLTKERLIRALQRANYASPKSI